MLEHSEQLGVYVQSLIDNAKRGDHIELPDEKIKVDHLYINKPVTLIGKPGTLIEACGSIHIDFGLSSSDLSSSLSKLLQK